MTEQQAARFLPFHAVNDFMLDDFRQDVLRTALASIEIMPPAAASRLNGQIKRHVQVPGFRNSLKAPPALKLRLITKPFEKSPDLAAAVLAAWAEIHGALRQKVFDVLAARGWELLPPDTDRTRLPGFFSRWPAGENYDTIFSALQQAYPDEQLNKDEVSLMAVWISMRLPFESPLEEDQAPSEEPAT